MTSPGSGAADDDYPALDGPAYELRLTSRALDDLGCGTDTAPGSLDEIASRTERSSLVEKFVALRSVAPTGTDAPMRNVGRPDVYSLHGSSGDRACTWHDTESEVCWLLGWVAQHDYAEFEQRAANGELLPDEDDYTVLEVERDELDFERRVAPGLRDMVRTATTRPGEPVRNTVGALLRLEVSIAVVPVDEDRLADIFITVRVPPLDDPPPGWPGRELPVRLAELAVRDQQDSLDLDHPVDVPAGGGTTRTVDVARELTVVVRNHLL